MSVFRCYIVGSDGHFRDVVSVDAASDIAALALARTLPAAQAGFELWDGSRLVHRQSAMTAAATPADKRAGPPLAASVRILLAKLERFAAAIGETLAGTRVLAVVRTKEKRRQRR